MVVTGERNIPTLGLDGRKKTIGELLRTHLWKARHTRDDKAVGICFCNPDADMNKSFASGREYRLAVWGGHQSGLTRRVNSEQMNQAIESLLWS